MPSERLSVLLPLEWLRGLGAYAVPCPGVARIPDDTFDTRPVLSIDTSRECVPELPPCCTTKPAATPGVEGGELPVTLG